MEDIPEIKLEISSTEIKEQPKKLDRVWTVYKDSPLNHYESGKKGWTIVEYPCNYEESDEYKKEYEELKNRNKSTDIADYYRDDCGEVYSQPEPRVTGSTVLRVLQFLSGKKFDNLAMRYIHSLRPSVIRATTGLITCDSHRWRVTVYLEKDNETIRYIEQEVEVSGSSGWDLSKQFKERYGEDEKRF